MSQSYRGEANWRFRCNIGHSTLLSLRHPGALEGPETIETRRATSVTRIMDLAMVQ